VTIIQDVAIGRQWLLDHDREIKSVIVDRNSVRELQTRTGDIIVARNIQQRIAATTILYHCRPRHARALQPWRGDIIV